MISDRISKDIPLLMNILNIDQVIQILMHFINIIYFVSKFSVVSMSSKERHN